MINRLLSMGTDMLEVVNEFQKFWAFSNDRGSYLFYSQLLPKGKRWNRYVKPKAEKAHDEWVIKLIAHHHLVSETEAIAYLDLMFASPQGKESLKHIMELYGTEPRKIKKVVR